ncbi:hypothetical protein [Streptomyces sp. N35]|uniref:hypothetical protein n=1 Tax=Streptomyces sp. N35 TaxID=2795730 RepID=UPI0018F37FF1|nr:hypothetical protein [Streptomyces sp. N35]
MSPEVLTIETAAGRVYATGRVLESEAVVFELGGAMRGSVYVTGTHHPRHWDQFTAVRACLGPVNSFKTTAPDRDQPRLAHGHTGYRGSLTLYNDGRDSPTVYVHTLNSVTGHAPTERVEDVLTAVLEACAEHVAQLPEVPAILDASRERDTPALLAFLDWSVQHSLDEIARMDRLADETDPARRKAVAAWWTAARWLPRAEQPAQMLALADHLASLSRALNVLLWQGPYYRARATEGRARARRTDAEAHSLRVQQNEYPYGHRPHLADAP